MAIGATTTEISMTTDEPLDPAPGLYTAYNVIAVFIVTFTMLAMGSGISLDQVKSHAKKPIGPIIGLLCQFILMPLIAFGGAHALSVEDHIAIGMIVIASCPGGAPSNMFTFWSRGDLPLSVTMTACSCVLALLFMPLNISLYTRSWRQDSYSIPYTVIVGGILLTWIPLGLGILIRKKAVVFADKFIRVGSGIAFLMLVFNSFLQKIAYKDLLNSPWNVWLAAALMPLLGYSMGFGLAAIVRLPTYQCRTIAIETGIQNVGLALAMIALSFPGPESSPISTFPIHYLVFSGTEAMIFVACQRIYFRCSERKKVSLQCTENMLSQRDRYRNSATHQPFHDMTSFSSNESKVVSGKDFNGQFLNGSVGLCQSETHKKGGEDEYRRNDTHVY